MKIFLPFLLLLIFLSLGKLFSDPSSSKKKINAVPLAKERAKNENLLKSYKDFFSTLYTRERSGFEFSPPVELSKTRSMAQHMSKPGEKDQKKFHAYISDSFHLRAAPDIKEKEYVTNVSRGQKVEVVYCIDKPLDDGNRWCLIRLANKFEGYIPANLILEKNPPKKRSRSLKKRNLNNLMFSKVNGLRIRLEPSLESEVIGNLWKGEKVEILDNANELTIDGINGKWVLVPFRHLSGWVFSGYLQNYSEEEPNENEKDKSGFRKGEKIFVKSDTVRVYEDVLESYLSFTLGLDSEVEILDIQVINSSHSTGTYLLKITDENKNIGWANSRFFKKDKTKPVVIEGEETDKIFQFPLESARLITSPYGPRIHPITKKAGSFHHGMDISAVTGTPILAAGDGTVKIVADQGRKGFGKYIVIEHKGEYFTYYAHQSKFEAQEGQTVKAGEVIGYVGSTGASTGPHLHFEVRQGNKTLDPKLFVPM